MSSSNLPVEVLQVILKYVDKADLLTLCRVNKVCCSCSQDILYRNILANSHFRLRVCRTLAQSTHLARRVRSFSVVYFHLISTTDPPKDLAMAMQNMSSLRSLKLYVRGRYSILDGCTFKLDSFFTDFPCDEYLRKFLNNQPTLTHVELHHHTTVDVQAEFEATCLPSVTRVTAELPLLQRLLPGRPLNDVSVVGWYPRYYIPSIDFFTLSTAPIQKLTITSRFIYTTPIEFLASIFPSLTHLSIRMEPELSLDDVRGPLFISLIIGYWTSITAEIWMDRKFTRYPGFAQSLWHRFGWNWWFPRRVSPTYHKSSISPSIRYHLRQRISLLGTTLWGVGRLRNVGVSPSVGEPNGVERPRG